MQRYKYVSIILILTLLLLVLSNCSKKTSELDLSEVATPTFNPPGGSYEDAQNVSITCATYGATIRYTTDGNDPSSDSAIYSSSISISSSSTIKTIGYKHGWTPSPTSKAIYTITSDQTVATPAFSPPGGSYEDAQIVSIACATDGEIGRAHV